MNTDFTPLKVVGQRARHASKQLLSCTTAAKNQALHAIADAIEAQSQHLLQHNQTDLEQARQQDLDAALIDRLELNPDRIHAMAEGLRQIAALPDPVGAIRHGQRRPSGIEVMQMRVPLGVIGIIYESRPNVTADAAALCLKSGNAAILRGGSEAFHSNHAILDCIRQGLHSSGLPADSVQVLETTDRSAIRDMVQLKGLIDVIVPRGGKGLIRFIEQESRIPVIKHLHGVCHTFIDCDADPDMALRIAINAKTQRYGTCNTMETLLLDQSMAKLLPKLVDQFHDKGVELRGCAQSCALDARIKTASEADWDEEYLAPILAIRMVDGLDAAMEHIDQHSSQHTDVIVTNNLEHARRFVQQVDSSSVMVNASSRFADGFEYGLGAEIGISTDKLHARGPVGLEGLTSEKYVVYGNGCIRQ